MLKKEFLLIFRDIHALLVLFAMPLLFIVIMSLALKNSFDLTFESRYNVAFLSQSEDANYLQLIESMQENNLFTFSVQSGEKAALLYEKGYDFVVVMPKEYKKMIQNNDEDFMLEIITKPDIANQYVQSLQSLIAAHVTQVMMGDLLQSLGVQSQKSDLRQKVQYVYMQPSGELQQKPTSVQYSVPAWLVFSIFFILIPVSNTFINEKNESTIERIKTTGVSMWALLFSKFIPYFTINQIQLAVMLVSGFFIVPLLGGDKLTVQSGIAGLFVVGAFVSFAAICFALLIANIAKTTEEATTIGGVTNIVLAALGGIMVPKFVMPALMQDISNLSPMSWALEGFLEFILKSGQWSNIWVDLLSLLLFGIICLLIAYAFLKKGVN
jgi:ABC-2 type transport system permease protein